MAVTTILLTVGIGLVAGVLSGVFGIGGGVVMVPAMVLLLGLGQKTATGTSLAALVLPVGILAVAQYYRADHVQVPTAAILAGGIFVGSLVGARVALGTSDQILRRLFALLLIVMAARLVVTS